jgi:hypothetical protein
MSMIVPKDPSAVLDYGCDWTDWLAGDTISISAWVIPAGLTEEDSGKTDTLTTVWLSGGTLGNRYTITNTITTAGGRTDERSLILVIKNR